MPTPPAFLIHTGDITQLSNPEEFEKKLLKFVKDLRTSYVDQIRVLFQNVKQLAGRLQDDAGTMAGDAVAIDRALRLFVDKLRAA